MASARPIWKGHVSFGLVNIPVTLYSAEQRNDIHFHLLDSRNSNRVRYQRVNEETGEEVPWDRIVKGYEYDGKGYVVLSKEEMDEVRSELTKQIEIEDFVDQADIDPVYFDKPYYLEPGKGAAKAYALLRNTLRESDKLGIARVVIRSREHLAALMVRGSSLVLELLRFPQELRSASFLDIPDEDIKLEKREKDLAMQLVDSMSTEWDPERYHDEYRDSLLQYIEEKVKRGELSAGSAFSGKEEAAKSGDAAVVDLMDYLKRSLDETGGKGKGSKKKASKRPTKKKTAAGKKSKSKGSSRKAS